MDEFTEVLLERVRGAQADLEAARRVEDVHGVTVAAGELEDMLRLARDHGIELGIGRPR